MGRDHTGYRLGRRMDGLRSKAIRGPTVERLEEALAPYPGALALATHDAAFAERCTSSAWRIASGRVET